MDDTLTFVAEEVNSVFGLVWNGVGVAMRLNNLIFGTSLKVISRMVQLLFLLIHKTFAFIEIFYTDLVLFLSDIGLGMRWIMSMIGVLATTGQEFLSSILCNFNDAISSVGRLMHEIKQGCFNWVFLVTEQTIVLLELLKHAFILFGSSVMFLVAFVPQTIYYVLVSLAELLYNVYVTTLNTANVLWKSTANKTASAISNYVSDIPMEVYLGVALGICGLLALKHLVEHLRKRYIFIMPKIDMSRSPDLMLAVLSKMLKVGSVISLAFANLCSITFTKTARMVTMGTTKIPVLISAISKKYVKLVSSKLTSSVKIVSIILSKLFRLVSIILSRFVNLLSMIREQSAIHIPRVWSHFRGGDIIILDDDDPFEDDDEANDENGNDNNANVPNLNLEANVLVENLNNGFLGLMQNLNLVPPPPALAPQDAVGNDLGSPMYEAQQLARRPLTRSHAARQATPEGVSQEFGAHSDRGKRADLEDDWVLGLRRELEQEREDRLCVVCQDLPKCIALLPCRHLCLCEPCRIAVISRNRKCPVCRRPIMDTLRIYT